MRGIITRGNSQPRRILRVSARIAIWWLCALSAVSTARAAVFKVDRTDDDPTATACDDATPNDCSLRGAIIAANALAANTPPEASEIDVPAGAYALTQPTSCSYRLRPPTCATFGCTFTSSLLSLCANAQLTIRGAGAATTTIDGGGNATVLLVSADASVDLSGLTLTNGQARSSVAGFSFDQGGGIDNQGTLSLTDAAVTKSNTDGVGGGIFNGNSLTLVRTTVDGNAADSEGAGIFAQNGTTVTVTDSTISNNTSTLHAGGIDAQFQSSVAVTGSTIQGNRASGNAGGIQVSGATTMVIMNSTITGNTAGLLGGGLLNVGSTATHLENVTITNNTAVAGGGIYQETTSSLLVRNSIIAGNSQSGNPQVSGVSPDCQALGFQGISLTSGGYNLIGNSTNCTVTGDTTGNLLDVDSKLAPLADNGGPTRTHALLEGSPAIDAANPAGCTDDAGNVLATDQRGSPRMVDGNGDGSARCDMGAFELGSGVTISRVQPSEGGNGGSVLAIVHGTGFQSGATVKLVRAGETDVVGTDTNVGGTGEIVLTRLDLTGRTTGAWDVVVTNPDGSSASGAGVFTIASPTGPELWVDVLGPPRLRTDTPARYVLLYGNRGNTDAFAVPLILGAADALDVRPLFDVAPPPQQFGKIVIQQWSAFYEEVQAGNVPPLDDFILLLSVVPAGFTGALEVTIEAPDSTIGSTLPVRFEDTTPMFDSAPTAAAVAALVGGARDKAQRLFGYSIPTTTEPDMENYISTQLDTVVSQGLDSLVASFGASPKVFSLTQIGYDLAAFGMVWADLHETPSLALLDRGSRERDFPSLVSRLAAGVADFCSAPAYADLACACGTIPKNVAITCCEGCSCPTNEDKDPTPPSQCTLGDIQKKKSNCPLPTTPGECREVGFHVQSGRDASGNPVSICTNDPRCLFPNSVGVPCVKFQLTPVKSKDPNDKSGPAGGGDARFITTAVPLRYTVEFENEPTATAPAAQVVITDQLDPTLVDLTTLSLGPIDFGATQVVPPPGSSSFKQDVDLRPGKNLIVRIDAGLDATTSVLAWRLTSLDPTTMQPPTDPEAGFLPPDQNPPEGDGHVVFTVASRSTLTTGTQIKNQARIVFDDNDPIDTPVWSNTIDVTPPTSQVTSIIPAAMCSPDLNVQWSGDDVGSGIGAFTILASEGGGPFTELLATAATSMTFHGKWGTSYVFESVASDLAGNVETAPTMSPPATVADCGPHDLAVTKIAAPKTVKLTAKLPARTTLVRVQIQNRSPNAETIGDAGSLANLVTLAVNPIAAGCPAPEVKLHSGKPQVALPLSLASKKKLNVVFDVVFDCAGDPAKGAGHEDFTLTASVQQSALGGVDAHSVDDTCPRTVSPAVKDPFPDGKIVEKGCGTIQKGHILGGPVLVDVVVP